MSGTTSGVEFKKIGNNTDMTIFQGKTINFSVIWGGATPIDITGWDARMQLRESVDAADPFASFTVANGRISIGGVNGTITVSMDAADCAALAAVCGVYDFEVINGAAVYQAFSGNFTVQPEITK